MRKIQLFLVSFILFTSMYSQQIKKIEPPFWWAGMNLNKIQLMIYGDNIAQFEPTVVGDEVVLKGVIKTENSNYVFLDLDFSKSKVGTTKINFLQNGAVKFSVNYELKQRVDNSKLRKGFNSSDLIYLLMPDRFANGNSVNDSNPILTDKFNRADQGGRHGGDIQGIKNHLDYLNELGVTAVWSTPLLEDNEPTNSYHTYAQTDVYKIDPRYGTNEEYKELASELHKRNMKLIMDYVTNHWGINHWMMNDLPTYTWINQFPGYANSNYRMTTQYDTNASKIDAKYCMDGWFVKSMPDLNQKNPLVLNYLIQNAIWWIEYANLDGFRVDTYSYADKEGISKWTKTIMDEYPNFNIMGEVWMHNQAAIAYWQKDSKIGAIQSFNSYLPTVMDFTLLDVISNSLNEEKAEWNKGMINIYDNFSNDYLYANINNLLVFAENHDTQRFNQAVGRNLDKYKLAMTLIATIRGIPQIYYGSEIGMEGDKAKGDGDIRRDFPGGWVGDENNAFTAEGRTDRQNEYFNFTKKIFNWRKTSDVIHTGKTKHYIPENNVYVYFRYNDTKSVMVILNNNPSDESIALNRFAENLSNYSKGKDILSNEEIDLTKPTLEIKGKKEYIIDLQ